MIIQTNTTDRKALVKAIAEELHTQARYLRTPTYAYTVGDFTVDRDGNIIGEDFAPLRDFLLRSGYITEEQETATDVEATEAPVEDASTEPEEPAEVEAAEATVENADAEPEEPAEVEAAEATVENADAEPEEPTEVEAAEAPVEDASTEPEEPAEAQAEMPDDDAVECANTPVEDGSMESEPAEGTDSEEVQQPTEDSGTGIDNQTITIPAPGITVEQLRNLTYTLYSRQYILNLMTGGETIAIPLELVEALKQAHSATPEDFTALLDSHKEHGLQGFDFKDGQFTLTFPFYETEPTKWTTFAGLQGRILQAALMAKRVIPELIKPDEEAEKYTAHIWLQRMGYKGPEMKEQRNILLQHLHGYCAFSNGVKMQNHKDKYSAIRRERREAERAATQTADEAITPSATEPESPVAAHETEVASDE